MYKIMVLATVVASVLSSCSNKRYDETPSKPVIFTNNIESDEYWGGQVGYKKVTNAHSGNMISLANEENQYSTGFHHKLIDLPDTSVNKINISAWVNYADTSAKMVLVISVDNTVEGKNIAWLGIPIDKKASKITPNNWAQVAFEYKMPKMALSGNEVLTIYFWNQSKEDIMVDDFEVKMVKTTK